jgi:TolA-binding protein
VRVGGDNCAGVDERLVDYAYDELPSPDRKGVEAHLVGCARCRASVEEMAQTRRVMQSLVEEPPPDAGLESLIDYARKGAERRTMASPRASPLRWLFGALPVAGLLVVVLLAVNRSASEALLDDPPSIMAASAVEVAEAEDSKSAGPLLGGQAAIAGAVEVTRGEDLPTLETPALSLEKKPMVKSKDENRHLDRGGGAGVGFSDKVSAPAPAMKSAAWPDPSGMPEPRSRRVSPGAKPFDGPSEPLARVGSDIPAEASRVAGPRGNIADSRAATNFASPVALARKARPAEEREASQQQRSQEKERGAAGEDLYSEVGPGSAVAQSAPIFGSRPKAEASDPALVSEAALGAAGARGSVLSVASAPPEPPAATFGRLRSAGDDFEGHGSIAKGFVQKDSQPRASPPPVAQAPATPGPARDHDDDDEADTRKEENKVRSSAAREPAAPAAKKADLRAAGDPFRAGIDASSRGDRDEAISLLSRAITDQPTHAGASDALFLLARQQWARGDLAGALRSYEQFVARFPTHASAPQAILFRAQLLSSLHREEEADRALDDLEKRYPHSPQVREVGRMRARAAPARVPTSAAPVPAAAH